MPTNIDDKELARLEELEKSAGYGTYSAHEDSDPGAKFAAAACNAVPALVAEVRRLRTENTKLANELRSNDEEIGIFDIQNATGL